MQTTSPFETHHECYDLWYERNAAAYVSELLALRPFVPMIGRGLEIGGFVVCIAHKLEACGSLNDIALPVIGIDS
jgi:hypothetical protein